MLPQRSCMHFAQHLACASASQRRILSARSLVVPHRKQTVEPGVKLRFAVPSRGRLPAHPPPLYRSAAEPSSLKPEAAGPLLRNPSIGEGMKAHGLPPPQNISNFHLSSLRITCLTRAGAQAALICPFARTLCKQSASYLLCEEGEKNDLIALAGHVIGHPFILLTINYICNQRDSTFSTSKTLLSKAIGMLRAHHACPESMNFEGEKRLRKTERYSGF